MVCLTLTLKGNFGQLTYCRQTLVDIVVAGPTRRDLVERAAIHDLVAVTYAERRNEAHYRDCAPRANVPFALEIYGAFPNRSDRF